MKRLYLIVAMVFNLTIAYGQKKIEDIGIIHQQERMVYKQWDKDKFDPKWSWWKPGSWAPYAATWLLHPSYADTDRRPLKGGGEQTQRLALAAAMQVTSDYYKKQADTLRNTAITEFTNYSSTVAFADPLYLMYYKKELKPLDNIVGNAFINTPANVTLYMAESGGYNWYLEEMNSLLERYKQAKSVNIDRGQRILMYHRIMLEHRKLAEVWKNKLDMARMMLDYKEKLKNQRENKNIIIDNPQTADQRLNNIMGRRKTLK
jgi:hypothetical protein